MKEKKRKEKKDFDKDLWDDWKKKLLFCHLIWLQQIELFVFKPVSSEWLVLSEPHTSEWLKKTNKRKLTQNVVTLFTFCGSIDSTGSEFDE